MFRSLFLLGLVAGAPVAPREVPSTDRLTLRLRDAPLGDVVFALHELTGQGYVVDADVVGRVDVELFDVSPEEVERALEGLGLSISGAGPLRRVTAGGEPPTLRLAGGGAPLSFSARQPCDVRDFLRLLVDVSGEAIVAPQGSLGRFTLFANEVPWEDLMDAVLASAHLVSRREGGRIRVWRRSQPKALLLPVTLSDRHYGHVPYRAGETPGLRSAGLQGVLARELRLSSLMSGGRTWMALASDAVHSYGPIGEGFRLYDGKVESVGPEGATLLLDSGERTFWRIEPAPPGMTARPDGALESVMRALVPRDAGAFDESEGILRLALDAATPRDGPTLRAALSDLHYAWARARIAEHANLDAIHQFEAAYEIDRTERPWQAGEDLNEIGFAWTDMGEPERAVRPHQQALDLVRAKDFKHTPTEFSCVRVHPRSMAIEPSALDGLANAERVRGRLVGARILYERAAKAWRELGDPFGESAALTGLGLVQQGLGNPGRALELHRQALRKPLDQHPWARAVVLNNLGSAQLALGSKEEARASFDAALGAYRLLGDRGGEASVLHNLGALYESRSEWTAACAAYDDSLAAARDADDRRGQALTGARVERLLASHPPGEPALARCRAARDIDP